jgi:RNA polymerase sigma-70 factor (ECF subfamily)
VKGEQLESLSCAEMVKRLLAGISGAFGMLYGRYYSFVRNTCLKIVNNKEMADDLTQATFLRALEKIQYFQAKSGTKSFRKWIWKIAFRQSIDHLRFLSLDNKAITIALKRGMITATGELNPGKSAQKKEHMDILLDAVSRLPELTRNCIISHYFLGLKYVDICTAYCLTENQVTHQLFVGRRILTWKLRKLF